jgi:hypothetical protein
LVVVPPEGRTLHLLDPPDAQFPRQQPISTQELILRAGDAIGVARVLVRETAAYCEESRVLQQQARARREGRAGPALTPETRRPRGPPPGTA